MPPNLSNTHAGPATRAIGIMCLVVFLLVLSDACAKWLLDRYHPFQIVFLRGLIGVPMVFAAVVIMRGRAALRTHRLWVHILRGSLTFAATYAFFIGLRHLPLAEATAASKAVRSGSRCTA